MATIIRQSDYPEFLMGIGRNTVMELPRSDLLSADDVDFMAKYGMIAAFARVPKNSKESARFRELLKIASPD